ncbi:MAG: glycosyltransferase [Pseudomonadales bacterium]|nr:glycosyltransferase [Pseudomonadales bacterium]
MINSNQNQIDFSVVIPSRNRPELLRSAIDSVLTQTHANFELVVVNDGSDGENEQAYLDLATEYSGKVRFVHLPHTLNGHGPSGAINRGVSAAFGCFVTFLDDDDCWTDVDHLSRAWQGLKDGNTDVYLGNQAAYFGEKKIEGPLWLEGLDQIASRHSDADGQGMHTVTPADLMACTGFAHLNTTVIRRSLYMDIGGMDEGIRYECEWDLFLRYTDKAKRILFHPAVVSRHNAPDPKNLANVSTTIGTIQKMLYRIYLLDKSILFAQSAEIVSKATQHKIYTLKHITTLLMQEKKYSQAYLFARHAYVSCLDAKWFIYTIYVWLRKLTAK